MDENLMKTFAKDIIVNMTLLETVVNLQGQQTYTNAKVLQRVVKSNKQLGTLCAIGFGLTYLSFKIVDSKMAELKQQIVELSGKNSEAVNEATDEKTEA